MVQANDSSFSVFQLAYQLDLHPFPAYKTDKNSENTIILCSYQIEFEEFQTSIEKKVYNSIFKAINI